MNVTIRKATINDLDQILSLNKLLFAFETQFNKEYNLDWTYSETGKKYFRHRITDEYGIGLIAESEKEIAGYLIGYINTYSFRSINPIAELENMFVKEAYRRKGVGKQLVNEMKKIAKQRGVKRIKVGTLAYNVKAIEFYHRLGFSDFELILEAKTG